MTTQLETTQAPSLWKRLLAWLRAFEEAMDYDPQEYTRANIRHLNDEVKRLNRRLDVAERRNQYVTDGVSFPAITPQGKTT